MFNIYVGLQNQNSVTKITYLSLVIFVTPKAGDKYELLFNKLASKAVTAANGLKSKLAVGLFNI